MTTPQDLLRLWKKRAAQCDTKGVATSIAGSMAEQEVADTLLQCVAELEAITPGLPAKTPKLREAGLPKLTPKLREALECIASEPLYGRTSAEKARASRLNARGDIVRSIRTGALTWELTLQGRASLGLSLEGAPREAFEAVVKSLLHESRDSLRLQGTDTSRVPWDARDGYYGEAFGMFRTLEVLGLGRLGAVNVDSTLSSWLERLKSEVLKEEGFGGDNRCERCFAKYGRDGARPQNYPRLGV